MRVRRLCHHPMLSRLPHALLAGALALAAWQARAQAGPNICGDPYQGGAGPYDYRKKGENLKERHNIETAHFPIYVELLIRGRTTANVGGDINYTLRAIPNHHRALVAMDKLAEREKTDQPKGASYGVNCYFDRAVRYTPDDIVVRMLFARYLTKHGKEREALQQMEVARSLAGDNALSHYNLGLVFFEMKQYEQSLAEAHKAIALGSVRPELKQQLTAAGKWVEPAPAAPASAASAAAPAPAAASAADAKAD